MSESWFLLAYTTYTVIAVVALMAVPMRTSGAAREAAGAEGTLAPIERYVFACATASTSP